MKLVTIVLGVLTLCALITTADSQVEQSRRHLQSRQYPLDVGELMPNEQCELTSNVFDTLFLEASGYCSEALARVVPRPICQRTGNVCPTPGHVGCTTFPSPYCAVEERACIDQWFNQAKALGDAVVDIVGKFATGGAADAFEYLGKALDVMAKLKGLTEIDFHGPAFRQFVDAKKGLRAVFGRTWSHLHMEIAQHDFFDKLDKYPELFDSAWQTLSHKDQEMILTVACRNEADKALRLESEDQIKRDLEAGRNKIVEAQREAPNCFNINDSASPTERRNNVRDCAGKFLNLLSNIDNTGIAAVLESFNVEECASTDEYPYTPRSALTPNHPWWVISNRLGEQFSTLVNLGDVTATAHEDDRGNGESIMHQLKAKMLKTSCSGRKEIKYQKGVCRPFTDVNNMQAIANQHPNGFQKLTRSEILLHIGALPRDICCSKDGYTTITTEGECRSAFNQLYSGSGFQAVSTNLQIGGCNYDVTTDKIIFNSNMNLNNGVRGHYTPICKEGENQFLDAFNERQSLEHFVLGSAGEKCGRFEHVMTREHCRYALTTMFGDIALETSISNGVNLGCGVKNGRGYWNPWTQIFAINARSTEDFEPVCYKSHVVDTPTESVLEHVPDSCCSIATQLCDECPTQPFTSRQPYSDGSGWTDAIGKNCQEVGLSAYGQDSCELDPAKVWFGRKHKRVCNCVFTSCRSKQNSVRYDGLDKCILKDITDTMLNPPSAEGKKCYIYYDERTIGSCDLFTNNRPGNVWFDGSYEGQTCEERISWWSSQVWHRCLKNSGLPYPGTKEVKLRDDAFYMTKWSSEEPTQLPSSAPTQNVDVRLYKQNWACQVLQHVRGPTTPEACADAVLADSTCSKDHFTWSDSSLVGVPCKCVRDCASTGVSSNVYDTYSITIGDEMCTQQPNTRFVSLDYGSNSRTEEVSAEACRDRCKSLEGCTGSSWWEHGGCHVSSSTQLEHAEGVTSYLCANVDVHVHKEHWACEVSRHVRGPTTPETCARAVLADSACSKDHFTWSDSSLVSVPCKCVKDCSSTGVPSNVYDTYSITLGEDECDVSIWKKFPTNVYCQKGGDEFPDNGYKNNVNQEECEQFCTENAGCAGFLHRHGENNCKGQCHIRSGTPVEGGQEPGPLMCRYDEDGAGYSFYENPSHSDVRLYKHNWACEVLRHVAGPTTPEACADAVLADSSCSKDHFTWSDSSLVGVPCKCVRDCGSTGMYSNVYDTYSITLGDTHSRRRAQNLIDVVSIVLQAQGLNNENTRAICRSVADSVHGTVEYCSLRPRLSRRNLADTSSLFMELAVSDTDSTLNQIQSENFIPTLENLPKEVSISDIDLSENAEKKPNLESENSIGWERRGFFRSDRSSVRMIKQ